MKADWLRYPSKTQDWIPGREITFNPFVPDTGPNGRRVIVDAVEAEFDGLIEVSDGVGDTALLGPNLANLVARITADQIDGRMRRNLAGHELRKMVYRTEADYFEELDVAPGAAPQAVNLTWRLPFSSKVNFKYDDTAIPADVLNQIIVTPASDAAMSIGDSIVTVGESNLTLRAICHEEDSVRLYAEDFWGSSKFDTPVETGFPVGGLLEHIQAYVSGNVNDTTGGGAVIPFADFPSWTIDFLQNTSLSRVVQLREYLRDMDLASFFSLAVRQAGSGADVFDPVAAAKAVMLWFAPRGSSIATLPEIPVEGLVRVPENAVEEQMFLLRRVFLPKSAGVAATVEQKYGIDPAEWMIASRGKTGQDPARFERYKPYMPMKAAYRKRG